MRSWDRRVNRVQEKKQLQGWEKQPHSLISVLNGEKQGLMLRLISKFKYI